MHLRHITLTLILLSILLPAEEILAGESEVNQSQENQLLSRIDFGNSYIMGQTIKSGAVYLLNRKKSDIQSMLDSRKDYRREIREDAEVVDPTIERFSLK